MGETVDVRKEGRRATVVMHRSGNNSIGQDLLTELEAAFKDVSADPEVRVVVLASEYEKYFSVGADLMSIGGSIDRSTPDAPERYGEMARNLHAAFFAIEACPKPVIARINGHALGGGCELSLCCDYRVMVDDGRSLIGQTEVALGIIPGAGGTQRLPRLIGWSKALPLLLEGTRLSAREAEAVGLVSRAVAPEELDATVDQLVAKFENAATYAIGLIKDSLRRGYQLPIEQGARVEAGNFAKALLSEDAVIGVMAFLQKQTPEFKGS
ncbi:MAG TPA: enoyl-CoA hydratase/isomerase family protein [Candidatus Dormibacteraeota bacterium]